MNICEVAIEEAITELGYNNSDYIKDWSIVVRRAKEILTQHRDKYDDEWWEIYQIYLKSEHWKILRKSVLERSNFQCAFCEAKATQVNHLSYLNLYEPNEINDLIPLCSKCHKGIHGPSQRKGN
jgi:5-methylcytosine-specific restriction endonuclease McrA